MGQTRQWVVREMSTHQGTQAGDLPRQPYNTVHGYNGSTNPPPFKASHPFLNAHGIRVRRELRHIARRATKPCLDLVKVPPPFLISTIR
jgi:hypothetical protein